MQRRLANVIAKEMAGIDIAILPALTENGAIANRPMSDNGHVAYDGTSYDFTLEQTRTVSDIERNPQVALDLPSQAGILCSGLDAAVEEAAEFQRDKAAFQRHWTSDLNKLIDRGAVAGTGF